MNWELKMYLSIFSKVSKFSAITLLMGSALFLGGLSSAYASSDDINLDGTTPHGTFIEQGTDPALVGEWRVLQVQIEQGSNSIVFPVSGATLSILDGGSFKYDYTEETNGPRSTDIAVGDVISASRVSPVATCKMEATGEYIGHAEAVWEEETGTMDFPELQITIFLDRSTRAEVRCAGSDAVITNATTPSLGFARPSGTNDAGPYVAYSYLLDRDNFTDAGPNGFTDLEIWTVGNDPVRTRYYLRKMN